LVPPPPEVEGGVTTGAGDDVVTGGGAECVVAGAEVVVTAGAGATAGVVDAVVAGLGLGAALWWRTAGFLCLTTGSAVVVCDVVELVAGVAAAGVEVLLDVEEPPQPATATPIVMMASNARFIDPAPIVAPTFMLSVQDTSGA
jgi:hypothetical protein